MTVDFQSGVVTGTINWSNSNDFGQLTITGTFDQASMQVNSVYAGLGGIVNGVTYNPSGSITGTVSDDFGSLPVVLVNESGESFDYILTP